MTGWPPLVQPDRWSGGHVLHNPASWVFGVVLLAGGGWVSHTLITAFVSYPRATLVATALFSLYAVPFFVFIGRVDFQEPEPPILLAAAFGWGGLVAMAAAAQGNTALGSLLAKVTTPAVAARWGQALVAPTVEEPVKLLGVVMIVLIAQKQINSVVDGMVYGAVVGLGFQVVEDIVFALKAVVVYSDGDRIQPVIEIFLLRGFVCGLWSHTIFTSLSGLGVAYLVLARDRPRRQRVTVLALGFAGAWLCHFSWNSPLLTDGLSALGEVLVKGAPSLMLVLTLAQTAGVYEAGFYAQVLLSLDDSRIVTPEEAVALGSHGGRVRARQQELERIGWRIGRFEPLHKVRLLSTAWRLVGAVRRLHRAQARCAVEVSRDGGSGPGLGPSAQRAISQVLVAREQLQSIINERQPVPVDPQELE